MGAERLIRILRLLDAKDGPGTRRLCDVATEVTGTSGAGVMLLAGNPPHSSLYTTDATSSLIEEIQYTLGEGPGLDAHRSGRPAVEVDLAGSGSRRWTEFSSRALDSGARAVFALPVRVGAVPLGALSLYRDRRGPMSDEEHACGLVMADLAARLILAAQADAAPGELAADLEAGAHRWDVVHQATGMISVQLEIPVAEALVRLRARAFATSRLVSEVAWEVVERRLRFDVEN